MNPCDLMRPLMNSADFLVRRLARCEVHVNDIHAVEDRIAAISEELERLSYLPCNCKQCVSTRYESIGEMRGYT